jgi:hypothetical protein
MAYPVLYLLATLFVVVVPMVASPVETGIGCLMILSRLNIKATLTELQSIINASFLL